MIKAGNKPDGGNNALIIKTKLNFLQRKKIMKTKLWNNLSKIRNNAIGSIETKTSVTLTGKNNPMKGRVTKVTKGGSVQFFGNTKSNGYLNKKRRNALANGESPETVKAMESKPRAWGHRIPETPLVTHKGNQYVELIWLHAPTTVKYYLDGKPIDKKDIIGLKKSSPAKKDSIQLRTMKLDSITKLKCGKLSV